VGRRGKRIPCRGGPMDGGVICIDTFRLYVYRTTRPEPLSAKWPPTDVPEHGPSFLRHVYQAASHNGMRVYEYQGVE